MKGKSLEEILERIRTIRFEEEFDLLVAVANGGIIPAALLNQRLQLELQLLKLNFRGTDRQPLYDSPRLLEELSFKVKGRKILLVEDRIKTGATVACARQLLAEAALIRTFAVNGEADYCLYNEACFRFPWIL
ncbi:MAG: phosphoribosyltransferase [Culturomica sp.]|jgi:hypoxanthine phosphoribosyltransferase|nr:phosphoribosyltransferase [Culturomica sp.]